MYCITESTASIFCCIFGTSTYVIAPPGANICRVDSKDIFEAAKKDGASDDVKNIATNVRQNISKFYKDVKPTIDAVKDGMTTEKTALAEAKTKFKDYDQVENGLAE